MKRRELVAALFSFASLSWASRSRAEEKAKEPIEYTIWIVEVADTKPTEYLFQIDKEPGIAYKSLYSPQFRWWVSILPKGTRINYYPSCLRPSGFTAKELEDFEAYCKSKGILFPRRMAG